MCEWKMEKGSKAARMIKIGCFSLAVGLGGRVLLPSIHSLSPNLMDFAVGLCLGVSIAANLMAVRLARRGAN